MIAIFRSDRLDILRLVQQATFQSGGQILQSATPHGDGGNHGNPELLLKPCRIERQAIPLRQVHHVERHDDRLAERDDFESEAQVIVEIGRIEHQDDRVGAAFAFLQAHDHAAGDFLVGAGRIEAVAAGQVDQFGGPAVGKGKMTGFALDGHAGIVGDLLARAGERVEQGTLAGIGVARKDNERRDFRHRSGGDRHRDGAYRYCPGV